MKSISSPKMFKIWGFSIIGLTCVFNMFFSFEYAIIFILTQIFLILFLILEVITEIYHDH